MNNEAAKAGQRFVELHSGGNKAPALKPCPYCGKAASVETSSMNGKEYCTIGCVTPGCREWIVSQETGHPIQLLNRMAEDWNTRNGVAD